MKNELLPSTLWLRPYPKNMFENNNDNKNKLLFNELYILCQNQNKYQLILQRASIYNTELPQNWELFVSESMNNFTHFMNHLSKEWGNEHLCFVLEVM